MTKAEYIRYQQQRRRPHFPTPVYIPEPEYIPSYVTPVVNLPPSTVTPTPKDKSVDKIPVFYHSGDMGDIIYSLLSVKMMVDKLKCGQADIWLGPKSPSLPDRYRTRVLMGPGVFGFLQRLLESQPYIRKVNHWAYYPPGITYDFNNFRPHWTDQNRVRLGKMTLAEMHGHAIGLEIPKNPDPWLFCDPIHKARVIMNRSARYHVPAFPWVEAVSKYGKEAVFVGLEDEYAEFINSFGKIPRHPIKDALDLAQVVAGAELVVCNESFLNSVAISLGQAIVQETWSQACVFQRSNIVYFQHKKVEWPNLGTPVEVKQVTGKTVHFLTIVLDGMPYISQHLQVFNQLKIPWQWHIVQGTAANVKDTAWCRPIQPRLGKDGTPQYLENIKGHPNVHIYSHEQWPGKTSMVNEPLQHITEEAYLWQVDVDEIWTADKIEKAIALLNSKPNSQEVHFFCRYFVGPDVIVTSPSNNVWSNKQGEWNRLWKFHPGDRFASHEPVRWERDKSANRITREETSRLGLIFNHYAYATQTQARFKQDYYGYPNVEANWCKLQASETWPVRLKQFFPWVDEDCWAEKVAKPIEMGTLTVGPGENGSIGLGDILLFTPIIRQRPGTILRLPKSCERFIPLFKHTCEVVLSNLPLPNPVDTGVGHHAIQKLRTLGLNTADYLPSIKLSEEDIDWAKNQIKGLKNPIAFNPFCRSQWSHVREPANPLAWEDTLKKLSKKSDVVMFVYQNRKHDHLKVAKVFDGVSLVQQAALYHVIGRYFGVDTGDLHLMLAVGGTVTVMIPDHQEQYRYDLWHYKSPRVTYINFKTMHVAYDYLVGR